MMEINEDIFGTDRCDTSPMNQLYFHFPLDHLGTSLEYFPKAGCIVPVSTIGNDLR